MNKDSMDRHRGLEPRTQQLKRSFALPDELMADGGLINKSNSLIHIRHKY